MKLKSRFIFSLTAILMAILMIIPQCLTMNVFAADSVASNEVVLFEGNASAVGGWDPWQSITDITDFNVKDFEKPFTVKIDFEGKSAPYIIFMSWTGGASWGQVASSYVSKGVAYYTYDACCTGYGSTDFSTLNKINIRTSGEDVTITKVSLIPEETGDPTIIYKGLAGDIVNDINAGWNLGNTFDSLGDWIPQSTEGKPEDYETAWGNPVTTKAIIDKVKAAGFNAIRIPITWKQHIDDNNGYAIDKEWMARVQQVVDYVIEDGMYCIINIHHDVDDVGWLWASKDSISKNEEKFDAVWTQIANNFKNYDNKLLFEGFNEMLDDKFNWGYPGSDATTAVNQLNQRFVNIVRATGGNNASRCLVVNTYAASSDGGVLDDFVLPTDTVDDSLIVQFHFYTPYSYANVWGEWTKQTEWKDNGGKGMVDGTLINVYNHFSKKGIPVIMGEIAAANKDNLADRVDYAGYINKTANKYGIKCFWWDNGIYEDDKDYGYYTGMGLLDRKTCTWKFPEIVKAFTGVDPQEDVCILVGDVNGDGRVNIKDYIKLQKYIMNNSIEIDLAMADLNSDGKINITDALLLKKALLS